MFVRKLGIDLGTCNSLVFIPSRGVVLEEPSVVAVSIDENKILAVGLEAKEMVGRTPDTIRVYRPLREGVIADYRVTQAMLHYFLRKTTPKWWPFKPEVVISVPAGITSTERRAVVEAALNAGAKACYLVKEPILAALGANLPINSHQGQMIVNIGGGTSEVAIISLGGIVVARSIRIAGDKFDQEIANYIKQKYNLIIGDQTAEKVKIQVGTALPEKKERVVTIKGRDLVSGLPRIIQINSNEVALALRDNLEEILQAVKQVLRETPPELAGDIMEKGMTITGGSALLANIDKFFSENTGVPATVAEDPLRCVARGTGVILESLDTYKRILMSKR
jgi:rod shape-determining protein MreB and related proteins